VLLMTDIQARHAAAVLANELRIATTWGQPVAGYILVFRPDPAASAALAGLQQQVLGWEPALLRQPESQLHTSIAWLLPVSREFGQHKDEIWAEHGADWLKTAGAITDATQPMRLCYRRLVVTDAAIVAVANVPNPVAGFRRELTAALGLGWPITYDSVEIVHTSLFRYRQPLGDPDGLLRCIESMPVAVETEVRELLMVRESVYPTLEYQILDRLPLRGGHA
jgi:hypothetical protein